MYLNIVFFPFLTSVLIGFLGRFFGNVGSSFIACLGLFINFFFSFSFFLYSYFFDIFFYTYMNYWFAFGILEVLWSFSFDSLSLIMFIVVNSVSFVVHFFSFGYMRQDPHLSRFMSYISFFTFFMLILVTSDNLVQLFLGWEGVGLCSYLLIGFWYTRINAVSSAVKALIVNRISDFAIIFGLQVVFWLVLSYDFSTLLSILCFFIFNSFFLFKSLFVSNVLTILCFFFLIGAMGKSAQIFLHTWLPDAMEGPTPVSALIHAATMVTAGIFLIIKFSLIYEFSGLFLTFLLFIGGLTSFMSGTIGMVQYDIKKIIAYSTCSQLGYMLLACGLSNYFVSFFHLMNHAFFKALLFLCAGCIIHSSVNEQDMRKFGSFFKLLPVICFFLLLGSLALAGFTFLSGFYSKDFIIEQLSFYFYFKCISISWVFSTVFILLTTILTGYYSMRLFLYTFLDLASFSSNFLMFIHESEKYLIIPLFVLIFGTVFIGFFFRDFFLGIGSDSFDNFIFLFPSFSFLLETELLNSFIKVFLFILFIIISLGFFPFIFVILENYFFFSTRGKSIRYSLDFFYKKYGFEVFYFFNFKWGFDLLYNKFFNKYFLFIFYFHLYELFDKLFLERILGYFNILKTSFMFFKSFRLIFQNGLLFYYLFYFLFVFLFFFL